MRNLFKRSVSILLALVMVIGVLSIIPFASASVDYTPHDDYYKVISKTDYELAPGVEESEIVLNNADGSHRQVAHVVEVDPYNPYTKVMPSYKGMAEALEAKEYGVQIMSEQIAYAEANGYGNVVAGMNLSLSWYNSDYYSKNPQYVGEPLGYIVMDGVYYENSQGKTSGAQTCLVINYDEKDGVARPADIPKTEIRTTSSAITGWEEQVISANFGFLVKNGVNQYSKDHTSDAASRSFVGIKEDGTIVMVMNDGRQEPFSKGFNSYEMAEFMLSLGCVQAINGDGGGSSQFLSQRPGEEMELHCSPSDGAARATTHGILVISTAPATGEFVRAQITTDDVFYTPGSSVQFNAIGTDLVGTPADIPEDATWQLADSAMGTIDNTGLFVSNGTVGEVTAQLVYNDEVVGESTITIVLPEISFKQNTLVVPYGEAAEIALNITTNDGLNTVTTKDGDIVFTLSDSKMGTINGNIFTTTTDTTVTGGTITAVICGDTANAATATVKFGKASEIIYDFENNYELIIDNSPSGGDENSDTTKEYYYGWHMGDIRVDQTYGFRWTGYKAYPTTIGTQMGKNMYLVDKTTGMVRNGETALAVNVDYTRVTSMGSKQMNVWFPESIDVSEATSVGLWLYLPDVDHLQPTLTFRWCGYKADGKIASIDTAMSKYFGGKQGFTDEGWFYVSLDTVANNMATIEYIQFLANDASASLANPMSNYTFYIDDVTVDYSDATIDRENPYFTSVSISNGDTDVAFEDGYKVSENTVTVFAQATENTTKANYTGLDRSSVKVTVDGKEITNGVSVNVSGRISVVDLALSDGVHTLRFEIKDAQGNVGSITRKLVVGSGEGAVRFELDETTPEKLPAGSIMYFNLVADDIASVDKIETKVRLDDCNDWELEGMEVAYGFEATYTVNANNEAFLTFVRTSDEVADTNIIAKLPVRIWMTSTYLDPEYIALGYVKDDPALQDKYYALTPYAMWLSDGVSIIRLVMDVSEGIVTYTDGTVDTFSSEKYDLETELNRYRNSKNAGDANFYQDKASFHIHTPGEATDKAPTCKEAGYTGRVFCVGCSCDTVKRYNHECDTHEGCNSVIVWGETVEATGHIYNLVDGVLKCTCDKLFNGTYTDGKFYVDGLVIADGWNGESYYKDGKKLTGVNVIDGKYYNFGEDGICPNKYPMTSEWWTNAEGESFYFNAGVPTKEYALIGGVPTFFSKDGVAFQGEMELNGEICVFEKGVFVESTTADVTLAGRIGPDAYFVYYADGTLVLCGEGATYDFVSVGNTSLPKLSWKNRPWGKNTELSNGIKKIVVGNGITYIGDYLFYQCYNVANVEFEENSSLTTINRVAFNYLVRLKEITLPDSLQTIGNQAFGYNENLEKVVMNQTVNYIQYNAFVNSKKVVLDVAEGTYAKAFAINNNIPYTTRAFVEAVVDEGTFGNNLTWTFYESGKLVIDGEGAMPDFASRSAQPWAAYRDGIYSIEIGKDITYLGKYAFAYAYNVKSFTFEEGSKLERIGPASIYYLSAMTELNLPDNLRKIDNLGIAYNAKLANVYMPQAMTYIQYNAFTNSSKVVLNVAEGTYAEKFAINNKIAYTTRAFVEGVIAEGTFGNNLTWTFYESGRLVIDGEGAMPDFANRDAQPWAAYRDGVYSIEVGKDITYLGKYAFAYAYNVKSVKFAEDSKLERIGPAAVYYLSAMTEITLPDNLRRIDNIGLAYNAKLVNVYMPQAMTYIQYNAFTNSNKVVLNVAEGTYAKNFAINNKIAYTTRAFVEAVIAEGTFGDYFTWTFYESGKLVVDGVGAMPDFASRSEQPWAAYRDGIYSIEIGKDITYLGNYAFAYAHSVKSVKFEEGSKLMRIGAASIYYLSGMTELTLPETVKSIGNLGIAYNAKLANVYVPAGITYIQHNAFNNCKNVNLNVEGGSYAESYAVKYGIEYTVR